MKNVVFTIILAFVFFNSISQITAFQGKLGFETFDPYRPDTLINFWEGKDYSNIWEVKKPDGTFFYESQQYLGLGGTTYIGGENAILTNKELMIKSIDTTVLYIKFRDDSQLHNDNYSSSGTFSFFYKLDADSTERLNFYMSIDNGKTWETIFDTIDNMTVSCWDVNQFYNSAPSTGEEIGWIYVFFSPRIYAEKVFNETPTMGSIVYKFEFIANKNSPTEGVMFDEFRLFYHAVDVPEKMNTRLNIVKTKNSIQGIYLDKELNSYSLTIYNLQGQIIEKFQRLNTGLIDLSSIADYNGLIILSFTDKNTGEIITKKVIN
jgi:hypothetical protein